MVCLADLHLILKGAALTMHDGASHFPSGITDICEM